MGIGTSDDDGRTWRTQRLSWGDVFETGAIIGEPNVAARMFDIGRPSMPDMPLPLNETAYYTATSLEIDNRQSIVLSKFTNGTSWSTPFRLDLGQAQSDSVGSHSLAVRGANALQQRIDSLMVAHTIAEGSANASLRVATYDVRLSEPSQPVLRDSLVSVFSGIGDVAGSERIARTMRYPVIRLEQEPINSGPRRYLGVELIEPLPQSEQTEREDARCSFALFYFRPGAPRSTACPVPDAWTLGAPGVCSNDATDPNSGASCVQSVASRLEGWRCRRTVRSMNGLVQDARHFDVAARRVVVDGNRRTPDLDPLDRFAASTALVFTGHPVEPAGREDQVWFARFSQRMQSAPDPSGVCEFSTSSMTLPVNISLTNERCFHPTITSVGDWVHVTWHQQDPNTLRFKLMGRSSPDFGQTWRPTRVLSDLGTTVGASEPICPATPLVGAPIWSQRASSLSFVDVFYAPDDPRRIFGPLVDLLPSAVTFYTSGRNESGCVATAPNEAQFHEVTSVLWRN